MGSLEDKLYEKISKLGEAGIWLIPGYSFLKARQSAKKFQKVYQNIPELKEINYDLAKAIEFCKLIIYSSVGYTIYVISKFI